MKKASPLAHIRKNTIQQYILDPKMARKISKNSRAARNGEVAEPEAKTLESLPRVGKTDLTNILIRTTAKNEALLEAKLQRKTKKRVGKKSSVKSDSSVSAEKLERALNITGRLDGKIAKSIDRAKYIQNARKAGWDNTNEKIKKELAILHKKDLDQGKEKTKDLDEDHMKDSIESDDQDEEKPGKVKTENLFSILPDDVEV
ncbi:hypothetical protein HG535_0E02120 [Zygotorulaspora mrakii]|uniref:Uncharacterized protein n=1 Tax=Zygotorulaspora mrakii TaxID=42260 RepID=A0A7H9B395_ZYGMR|nr:uncharacterized protein HG535_0E02120 [Zygotorulaspora mrakii]QLG73128.1 hypothetical protein HG535_0E02120 [Zygotorulaspora mrakii]